MSDLLEYYQDAKEQIRRAVDLVDLVSEHVSLKRAGRNLKGLCPFHRENTPSFNVLPEKQIFKCFGCGAAGDVFKFVQLRETVGFGEAVRILADRIGLRLETRATRADGAGSFGRSDLARVNEWAAQWFRKELNSDRGAVAQAYLAKRRISAESAELFHIGAAAGEGRLAGDAARAGFAVPLLVAADLMRAGERGGVYETFRDRLIFPIRDSSKRCLGFGGRTLADAPAKYLNSAQTELFDKSKCLFGLDQARNPIGERGEVVVVEGYTDCIACHQHGFKNTIATLGTAATDEHMGMLRRYVERVILFFDSDAAGEAAAERASAIAMRHNLQVRLAKVPEGKDPAEYLELGGEAGFGAVLNSAVDALGFLWDRTLARFQNPSGGQGRRRAAMEFVQLVGELSRFRAVDAIQRGLIINQVSRLLGLPVQEVSGLFAPPARAGGPTSSAARETNAAARGKRQVAVPVGDAEQMALSDIFGILLCRPDLRAEVAGVFRTDRFKEAGLRDIAERFDRMNDEPAGFEFSGLLASIESPEAAGQVTDLAMKAMDQGNHEETLANLCERLALIEAERPGREASRSLADAMLGEACSESELDSRLLAVQQGYSQRHHFSPPVLPRAGLR